MLKKPGKLTDEEFEIMKQHPIKGANIMRPVAQLAEMLPGIELHHECVDGHGYPYGLVGDQIPLMARIIAVCDTLDAITTNRPYQSAMELDFAVGRIRNLAGTKFDPSRGGRSRSRVPQRQNTADCPRLSRLSSPATLADLAAHCAPLLFPAKPICYNHSDSASASETI